MSIVVGVDGGGSHCRAAIADDERVLLRADGQPANVATLGVRSSADALGEAISSVLAGARPDAIYAGVAGAGRVDLARSLALELSDRFPGALVGVGEDVPIALRAGAASGDAAALLAGTGSIAYAEVDGVAYRCGGHGFLLGDEGSGAAIGLAALRLLARSFEGRASRDAMLTLVAERIAAADAHDVIGYLGSGHSAPPAAASIAPLVLEAAAGGERSASKIVQQAALDLFELLRALARSAGLDGKAVPLVFAGGLLGENSLLSYLLETRIASEFPLMHIVKGSDPIDGALAKARELLVVS